MQRRQLLKSSPSWVILSHWFHVWPILMLYVWSWFCQMFWDNLFYFMLVLRVPLCYLADNIDMLFMHCLQSIPTFSSWFLLHQGWYYLLCLPNESRKLFSVSWLWVFSLYSKTNSKPKNKHMNWKRTQERWVITKDNCASSESEFLEIFPASVSLEQPTNLA